MTKCCIKDFCAILLAFSTAVQVLAAEPHHVDPRQYRLDKIKQLSASTEALHHGTLAQKRPGVELEAGDPMRTWEPAMEQNAIDGFTFKKMAEDGVPVNALCDDGTFIRRVALLLTGRLPDPEQTRAFHQNKSPDKRASFIDEVLASEAFNTHWSFWFQEYFQSTGRLLRGGQPLYNQFFNDAVVQGKQLDQMARELLTGFGLTDQVGEANFYLRANEMARLAQDFWDNAAIHTASKFLGVPMECISCHDGAYHLEEVNLYLAEKKREDLWAMAAFFSGITRRPGTRDENIILSFNIRERPSEGYLAESDSGDRPVRDGGLVPPKYLFSGAIPPADKAFSQSIADLVVADRQFARNWANRLWGHLFGLAMVEPMDGFDLYRIDPDFDLPEGWQYQALDLDLLEHMTDKMAELQFDLRAYLRYVLNSATFQMSSEYKPGNWQEAYAPYYTRYLARHMTAEMVYDSVVSATGVVVPIVLASNRDDQLTTIGYAHELPDMNQPRGRRQSEILTFLQGFGQGNRYDLQRTNDGNVGQALLLMNSPVIHQRLLAPSSRLIGYIQAGMEPEQIARELYLDIFAREPDAGEVQTLFAEVATFENNMELVSSIQWLLLNKADFTFIY